jgi:serine O-acetyltransferase
VSVSAAVTNPDADHHAVMFHHVPARATVAGVPARIVGWSSGSVPALEMDQSLPDYEI